MKKNLFALCQVLFLAVFFIMSLACSSSKKTTIDPNLLKAVNAPEESGIIFTRITPEGTSVIAASSKASNYLALNHKGDKLAYLSRADQNDNIYTLSLDNRNISQQRTFRNNVDGGFIFSPNDEELLFNSSSDLLSTNSSTGAICKQITTGWWPAYSPDGKYIFFQRSDGKHNVLWRYSNSNKELATLCSGSAVSTSKSNNSIYFLRYITRNGRSFNEIRKFNYETGNDEVILSNDKLHPSIVHESPDGKWLLFAAIKYEEKKKSSAWSSTRQLYVMRTDGSDLTQLTYHVAGSFSPVWSKDGSSIYFISGRGNVEQKYAIWSMPFGL